MAIRERNRDIIKDFKAQASKLNSMISNFNRKQQEYSVIRSNIAAVTQKLFTINSDLDSFTKLKQELTSELHSIKVEYQKAHEDEKILEKKMQQAIEEKTRISVLEMTGPLLACHDKQLALYGKLTRAVQNAESDPHRGVKIQSRDCVGRAEETVRGILQDYGRRLPYGPDAAARPMFLDD